MSYNSHTGYYGSSLTPSNLGSGAYSSGRGSDGQGYQSQLGSSGAQHMNYNTSNYNYSNAPSYTDNSSGGTGLGSWKQDSQAATNYNYQRNDTYANQETASGNIYTSSTYTRPNTAHNTVQNHAHGLSNLAYASGLNTANSRSNNVQSAQRYESAPQASYVAQDETRSPRQSQSRYAVNPPTTHTSYPMQTQNSSSSTSSQQQAINAAAALAGAVNRRYPSSNYNTTTPIDNSAVAQSNKFSVPNAPQRTNSPQVNAVAGSQQRSSTNQKQTHASRSAEASRETQTVPRPGQNINQTTSSSNAYRPQQSANSIPSILTTTQDIDQGTDQPSGEVAEPAPTFIDPARVFNPYHREHEMKRLQAEADARRKAEEEAKVEEMRKQKELAEQEAKRKADEEAKMEETRKRKEKADQEAKQRQTKAQSGGKNKGSAKSNPTTVALPPPEEVSENPDAVEQAAMAAEMKAMMEKMKVYRNRDPAFFHKMWEEIRKPGANGTANSVQSPSPQLVDKPLPAAQISQPAPRTTQTQSTTPNVAASRQTLTGAVDPNQNVAKNGYRVVVEGNADGLPDLGRFPAERRVRKPTYNKRKSGVDGQELSNEASASSPSTAVAAPNTSSAPAFQPASATPAALTNIFPPTTAPNAPGSAGTKPTDKQNSGTVWPVEKRTALINTALKVLRSNPDNAKIHLTEAEFHQMLANNPSYIGLCEMLEKKGLRFHRNVFARDLLNSVPELEASSRTPATPAAVPAQAPAGPIPAVTPQMTNSLPPPPAARPSAVVTNPPPPPQYPPAPYGTQYGPAPGYYPHPVPAPHPPHPMQNQVPMTAVAMHPGAMPPQPPGPRYMPYTPIQGIPTRPQPIPGSKEAAARKRDFSELIDLTELGDDENYVMPNKHARLDGPDSDTEMEGNLIQAFQTPNPMKQPAYALPPGQYGQPHSLHFAHYPKSLNGPNAVQPEGGSGSNKMILAKALNKDEALTKMYYDPKTVATDILIATGRHPSERPLNVHLAGMLGKYIELNSDVSTFDWDEIDPGGPPAPKVAFVDLPASKPRFKLGERTRRRRGPRKLIDTSKPGPLDLAKRTAWRAVTKSGDQSAGAKGAQSSPLNPQTNSGEKTVSQPLHLEAKAVEKKLSLLRQSLLASTNEGLATPSTHDPTINRPTKPSTSPSAMNTPQTKKRGRPAGSKNKYPSVAGLKERAIRVNVPTPQVTPSKAQDKFRCKWKKCNTVLHNLDTLRKHIGRVHRPSPEEISSEGYICWWKKCRFLTQDENGDWITVKSWPGWEEWLSHIEREHVAPIAMKWGDGPATQHIDPLEIQQDRQRYLSTIETRPDGSEHLVETTPLISAEHNDSHPSDVLNLTRVHSDNTDDARGEAEVEALRYFMHAHKIKRKSRQASEEIVKAMEKRKEKIGPGIDRGGCTLITEDMRDVFVQNPGIRRVIKIDA